MSILEVNNDITEQKSAETALRIAEERLRLAVEGTGIGIWDYNITNGVMQWSTRCKEIFGLPTETEMNYQLWRERVHPADRARADREAQTAIKSAVAGKFKQEYRTIKLSDGIEHWIASEGQIILNDKGEPSRFVGTILDITDRKEAESATAKLATIVESSDDAIISETIDGTITSWNNGAEKIFGYKASEIIGKNISILFPENRRNEEIIMLEKIQRGESVEHIETDRLTKDGRLINISLGLFAIRDASGNIINVAKIARDITERKRLEQQLQERNRELEKLNNSRMLFMRTISHELGNILNAIVIPIGILQKDITAKQREKMFSILKRNIADMRTLLDQLMDYSTILAGQESLRIDFYDINQLLAEITELVKPVIESKGLRFELASDPTIGGLASDQLKIKRVIHNLLSNAIKYTNEGYIKLSIKSAGQDSYQIIIEDSGEGISEDNIKRLFQEFHRFSSRSNIRGTGLGLAITKRLVKLLQGRIEISSTLSKGTRVVVILPKVIKE